MAESMKDADVYRVCAGGARRWCVYRDQAAEPVATFDDKAAALNYAMCLARGRVAWHLLLRQGSSGLMKSAPLAGSNSHH
jgi:hypothetical protein